VTKRYGVVRAIKTVIRKRSLKENLGGSQQCFGGTASTVAFLLEDVPGIEADRRLLFLIMDLNGELDLARSEMTGLGPSSKPFVLTTGC